MLKAADVHPAGYPTVVAVESMGKKMEAASNGASSFRCSPAALFVVLMMVTYLPWLSLWLPQTMGL